jgi:hypothetical protein
MTCKTQVAHYCLLAVALWLTPLLQAGDEPAQDPKPSARPPAQLTVKATVVLPDGFPASQAIIHSYDNLNFSKRTAIADNLGQIELQDLFLGDLRGDAASRGGDGERTASCGSPCRCLGKRRSAVWHYTIRWDCGGVASGGRDDFLRGGVASGAGRQWNPEPAKCRPRHNDRTFAAGPRSTCGPGPRP